MTTPAASATAAAKTLCRLDGLRVRGLEAVTEKTEQHTTAFSLENVGTDACTLDGYPGLALLDSAGHALPFGFGRRGDQMITAARPVQVRLAPRAAAFFAFNKNTCVGFTRRYAEATRITLPGGRVSRTIRLGPRAVDYCGAGDPGHLVTVSPIEARFYGPFCLTQRSCRRR